MYSADGRFRPSKISGLHPYIPKVEKVTSEKRDHYSHSPSFILSQTDRELLSQTDRELIADIKSSATGYREYVSLDFSDLIKSNDISHRPYHSLNRSNLIDTRSDIWHRPYRSLNLSEEVRGPAKNVRIDASSIHRDSRVTFDDIFKIVIILDESGSMETIKNKMIDSINDLIKEQKQVKERTATFTLVKFNDRVNRVVKNKLLPDTKYITTEDYNPLGSTALYDAIADTINWFKNEKNVLMIIVTDGQENASRYYSKRDVYNMIENKKKRDEWSFVYLSNDLRTAEQGEHIGLSNSLNSSNCILNPNDYGDFVSNELNTAIKNYRRTGMSIQRQLKRY
jgi:Mg-chelatase subunit ChlD